MDERPVGRLIQPIVDRTKSTGTLISATVGSVVAANVVTADQYIAIVLPAHISKPAFAKLGFAPVMLSRAVGAMATPSSAIVPWNSRGA